MGQPRLKGLYCFTVGVITGIIVGMVTLCLLTSYRLDLYYKENAYLKGIIDEKSTQLENLKKTINTQETVLKDIDIILIFDGDEIDQLEIEKTIIEKFNSLLGKEVKSIDVDLVSEVVNKRILKIEDREYRLQVEKIILIDVLQIWIKVELSST